MNTTTSKQAQKIGDKLYQKYGKSLEKDHWGEFIAISKDGKTVLGNDLIKVMKKSLVNLGQGSYIFKIGEIAVYNYTNYGR